MGGTHRSSLNRPWFGIYSARRTSRDGAHADSAFGLARAVPYARFLAAAGEPALMTAITSTAASVPAVSGSDYVVEHWLAANAVLLLGSVTTTTTTAI